MQTLYRITEDPGIRWKGLIKNVVAGFIPAESAGDVVVRKRIGQSEFSDDIMFFNLVNGGHSPPYDISFSVNLDRAYGTESNNK